LAVVEAGKADGLGYVLTAADPFAAFDLDDCRTTDGSIAIWAQNFLDVCRATYSEVTPSGSGIRIWGLTNEGTTSIHRKFTFDDNGKQIAAELFRRTPKVLTVTGYWLDRATREFTNIDKAFEWALVWGERRKAAAAEVAQINGQAFTSNAPGYGVDNVEQLVREGAAVGANRSDEFHKVVGHYLGCGWSIGRIFEHLLRHPDGVGGRYLGEGRLLGEITRSADKYNGAVLPVLCGWTAPEAEKAPGPGKMLEPPPKPISKPDEALDELEDEDEELDEPGPKLPEIFAHGDAALQTSKDWLIKNTLPAVGHGLAAGPWGVGKSFIALDLAVALGAGLPFLGRRVKQCGTLLIAAEGGSELRLRFDAAIRAKCGNMQRAPFRWYEICPPLLQKGSIETLIAMARQADDQLQEEFGLRLGLIVIDTMAAAAGYTKSGDENDPAVTQAVMNTMSVLAQTLGCFTMGVDHFGKNPAAGVRGSSSKESSADVVWAILGERLISGSVSNTRLAVRKHRGGVQGRQYPFALRVVEMGRDEDDEVITSAVVDWLPDVPCGLAQAPKDPWETCRRQDQQVAVLRLKRALMDALTEHGTELPIPPDGPTVRMIDQAALQQLFFSRTPTDGNAKQKRQQRSLQFSRALGWAERNGLIGIGEIDGVTHLWLSHTQGEDDES
jgi:hypothetical protein